MPKRSTKRQRDDANDIDTTIRHHLEEIATHLGAIRMLVEFNDDHRYTALATRKIGPILRKLYVRHGGKLP